MSKPINNSQPTLATGMSIALGEYNDTTSIDKFGLNPSVGTSFETIWDAGGVYTYLTGEALMTVASDAGATDAGVEVTLQGLDGTYTAVEQTVTLNASGTATTTQAFLRVFRAFVSNGSAPTDNIVISNSGTTYAQITYPYNQTLMAVYTIPAGKTGYLVSGNISSKKDKDITAKLLFTPENGVRLTKGVVLTPGTPFQRTWVVPQAIPAKTDVEIQAFAGATGEVAAGFEIILVDQ